MKKSIYFKDFVDEFKSCGCGDYFSDSGLSALFDLIEHLEWRNGVEYELDVESLVSRYTEYENIEKVKEKYAYIEDIDHLEEHTNFIEFIGGIIVEDF